MCSVVFAGYSYQIFAEGFRDNIFKTKTIDGLQDALGDKNPGVRSSAVKFFAAAIAQGMLHCFRVIFIPKHLQRAFGAGYSSLKLSPSHLDMH